MAKGLLLCTLYFLKPFLDVQHGIDRASAATAVRFTAVARELVFRHRELLQAIVAHALAIAAANAL